MAIFKVYQPEGIAQWVLLSTAIVTISLCSYLVLNSRRAGLSHIPGPFLARYTDAWAVYITWKGQGGLHAGNKVGLQRKLHAQYGDVVRTGPRTLTVFDPAAVTVIYGVRSKLDKVRCIFSVVNDIR